MGSKPVLVFVSTRFLFPADSGGKIRTTQILKGLKGGAFVIRLLMPCCANLRRRYASEIEGICDQLVSWQENRKGRRLLLLERTIGAFKSIPIPVSSDQNANATAVIRYELEQNPSVVVYDFPHSAILDPGDSQIPSVMFTHNIESEIFKRHWQIAKTPLHRWLWKNQYRKMLRFEKNTLQSFDTTIAVSDRDCNFFRTEYSVENCRSIPTGVDTEFFSFAPSKGDKQVVFCGSMDWLANIDGIEWFFREVWPMIKKRVPDARMKVVGRQPPVSLVEKVALRAPEWEFTGFVDDVRPHVSGADVFVIPLRVGGGTRIKAFEAMAMGSPVVSTTIGVEGLPVDDDVHYLNGDSPADFATGVVSLLSDEIYRTRIAQSARDLVESEFGFRKASAVFERICLQTAGL